MAPGKKQRKRGKRPTSPLKNLLKKRPKRTTNAFGIYLREVWSAVGNDPANRNRNVLKNAAAQWKLMSDSSRRHYEIASEISKERYREEMNTWKAERRFLTRPAGVFALFVKDNWQKKKHESSLRCIMCMGKYCSKQWKKLSLKEKQRYQERFERSKRRYAASLQDYKAKRLSVKDFNRILDTPEEYESIRLPEEKNYEDSGGINDEDDYQEVNDNDKNYEEEDFEECEDEYSEYSEKVNAKNSEEEDFEDCEDEYSEYAVNDKDSEDVTDKDDKESDEDEYAEYRQYL